MANIKAIIKQIGLYLNTAFRDDINTNFESLAQKDVDNYNELKGLTDAHTSSTQAHPAEKITYNGEATGTNVKDAIDTLERDINNLSFTGSTHDPLVTASLVDTEGQDFGAGGSATYLDGRLEKWEKKQTESVYLQSTEPTDKHPKTLWFDSSGNTNFSDGGVSINNAETSVTPPDTSYFWFQPI